MEVEKYRNSDLYLYEKSIGEADACYRDGKWYEAYKAYREAHRHKENDERALKGALLSTVEAEKMILRLCQ